METNDKPESVAFEYQTVSEQNRISILNMQSELLTIHNKIDLILEALKR